MRKLLLLLGALAAGACFTDPPPPPNDPVTMYARKSGVLLQNGGATLAYGEAIRCDRCDSATCFVTRNGKQATIVKSDLTDAPPPEVAPTEPQAIDLYEPTTSQVRLAKSGFWAPIKALQDHPETSEERRAKQVTEREAQREKVRRARDEAAVARKEAREAAVTAEASRRAFARQLRENYLASGANIKVSVSGAHAEHLTLEYPLIDDVWTYKFEHNDEAMSALRAKGFTYLHLSDGFNYGMRITL